MVTLRRQQEFSRPPRSRVSRPVTVEAGNRILHGETLDLGPAGAKLRLDERLQEGTAATLHFTLAEARPMDVEAIVCGEPTTTDSSSPSSRQPRQTTSPRSSAPRQLLQVTVQTRTSPWGSRLPAEPAGLKR